MCDYNIASSNDQMGKGRYHMNTVQLQLLYIYIFIYWRALGIKSYINFQVNYCQGIAIIVALELSFDSALL